ARCLTELREVFTSRALPSNQRITFEHRREKSRLVSDGVGSGNQATDVLRQALPAKAALIGEYERVAPADSRIEKPQFAKLIVIYVETLRQVVELIAESNLEREKAILHVLGQLSGRRVCLMDDKLRVEYPFVQIGDGDCILAIAAQ